MFQEVPRPGMFCGGHNMLNLSLIYMLKKIASKIHKMRAVEHFCLNVSAGSDKMKVLLYKSDKNSRKNIFSKTLKILKRYILMNIDSYIHIILIHQKFWNFWHNLEYGPRMHTRPWAHSWKNRALCLRLHQNSYR